MTLGVVNEMLVSCGIVGLFRICPSPLTAVQLGWTCAGTLPGTHLLPFHFRNWPLVAGVVIKSTSPRSCDSLLGGGGPCANTPGAISATNNQARYFPINP